MLTVSLVKEIQHIGSTAIPGIKAKPIIDILVGVTDLKVAAEIAVQPLVDLAYPWNPGAGAGRPLPVA